MRGSDAAPPAAHASTRAGVDPACRGRGRSARSADRQREVRRRNSGAPQPTSRHRAARGHVEAAGIRGDGSQGCGAQRHAAGRQWLCAQVATERRRRDRLLLLLRPRCPGRGDANQLPDPCRRSNSGLGGALERLDEARQHHAGAPDRCARCNAFRGVRCLPQFASPRTGSRLALVVRCQGFRSSRDRKGHAYRLRHGGRPYRIRHRRGQRALCQGASRGDVEAWRRGSDHVPARATARAKGDQAGAMAELWRRG